MKGQVLALLVLLTAASAAASLASPLGDAPGSVPDASTAGPIDVTAFRAFFDGREPLDRDRPTSEAFERWVRGEALRHLQHDSVVSSSEVALSGVSDANPHYELSPFADVNGDGRTDVLLSRMTGDGRQRLELYDAAGLGAAPLWMRDVETWSWYVVEDATEDGVADLILTEWGEGAYDSQQQSVGPATLVKATWTQPITYQVVDGSSGADAYLLEVESVDRHTSVYAYDQNGYANVRQAEYEFPYVVSQAAPGGAGGLYLVKSRHSMEDAWAYAQQKASENLWTYRVNHELHAVDGQGNLDWALGGGPHALSDRALSMADATGDGRLDLLFLTGPAGARGYVSADGDYYYIDPAVTAQEAHLYDGATGTERWSNTGLPFLGFGEAQALSDVDGDGTADFALYELRMEPGVDGFSASTRVQLLNGADGTSIRDHVYEDQIHYVASFADVDAKPGGELLAMHAELEPFLPDEEPDLDGLALMLEDAAGSPVWTREMAEDEFWSLLYGLDSRYVDYTGDGAADLTYRPVGPQFYAEADYGCTAEPLGTVSACDSAVVVMPHDDAGRIGVISGLTGTTVYEATLAAGWHTYVPVHDVTGDGGWDILALLAVEETPPGPDGTATATATPPPAPPSMTATATASTSSTIAVATPSHSGPPNQSPTSYAVTVAVHRGSDFALGWSRTLHSAALDPSARLGRPNLDLHNAGDVSASGSDDVLISLNSGWGCCVLYANDVVALGSESADAESPTAASIAVAGEAGPPGLSRVLVADSLDGGIHWAFPGYPQELDVVEAGPAYAGPPPEPKELDDEEDIGFLPGPGLVLLVAAVGAGAVLLRRRP